jgi:uncharacterized membrane protein YbhN (UPF0104 family)
MKSLALDRRALAAAGLLTAVVVVIAATPQLLGSSVAAALKDVARAQPGFLWLAGLGFLCSLVGSAAAWRCSLRLCGARLTLGDANARYGIGSLVNTFLPLHAGDAVRLALFSRTIEQRDRLWTTGGAIAAVGAARAGVLAVLVVCGAAVGVFPLWPLLVLAALVAVAFGLAVLARRSRTQAHVAHVLDAFRALAAAPKSSLRIVAWLVLATVGRVGAAASIAAALGVHSPLTAALLIIPTLDLAGLLPLTPGNFGVTSGAIAVALQAHGVAWTQALSTGIALHAVLTATGVLYGLGGLLYLSGVPLTGTRRWVLRATAATACVGLAAAFGATMFVDLV